MSSRTPLYPRLLRLRHITPNAWQRALLGEGALGLAAVLVLADLATAWTLLALPLAVAVVVKVHDVLAGLMRRPSGPAPDGWAADGGAAGAVGQDPTAEDGSTSDGVVEDVGTGRSGSSAGTG